MADYFAMAAELREAGLRAEAFTGGAGNMGKQLKYADRRGAAFAVICAEDERAQGLVTIKDLKLGAQLAESITDRDEWKEQKQQFSGAARRAGQPRLRPVCPHAELAALRQNENLPLH